MIFPELTSIRSRRQRLGIKQKQLAEKARVSQSLIAKIEKGIISPSYTITKEIFECLDNLEKANEKKCSEIMSRDLITISSEEKIKKASKIMKKNSISQIPVEEDGKIVSSITESLILESLLEKSKEELFKMKIKEICGESFPKVNSSTPIKLILPLLKHSQSILVYENQKLKGIITKSDVM